MHAVTVNAWLVRALRAGGVREGEEDVVCASRRPAEWSHARDLSKSKVSSRSRNDTNGGLTIDPGSFRNLSIDFEGNLSESCVGKCQ